jgi:quinoprotein glucose dehydrogenase
MFTPPSLGGTLAVPGNIGGLHWGGMVWEPTRRLLIAPVNRLPSIVRLIPSNQFQEASKAHRNRETTEQSGTPFAMSREFFMAPSGVPCTAPPWGELVAVAVDSGEIAWRAKVGDLRRTGSSQADSPTGSPNLGGAAVTDTGLLFIGATLDPYLRAYETRTGREIWTAALPTSARATPLVYTSARGRQIVAIAAGGHDTPFSKLDTKLVAFSLSDK